MCARAARYNHTMRRLTWLLLAAGGAVYLARRNRPEYDFSDRVVLITGGSRGLGLALARELAARGARLSLVARDPAELARAAESLNGPGTFEVHTVVADVSSEAGAQRAVAETLAHYRRLDVLINNAGVIQVGPLASLTPGDFEHAMQVNFFAALYLTYAARPHLTRAAGRIVNIASVGGLVPVPHLASYNASKFALVGFSAASRAELAREGITVTTVNPTLMRTGSPRQAEVRGQAKAEYAMFASLDHAPLLSLDAGTAARRIVDAAAHGIPELRLGGLTKIAGLAYQLFPGLVLDLMALGARVMPGPGPDRRKGADSETAFTRRLPGKAEAELNLNQRP